MKKNLMLVLVIALIVGCLGQPYTANAAVAKTIDGVKVTDLISGKYNNVDTATRKVALVQDGYMDYPKAIKVKYFKYTWDVSELMSITDNGISYETTEKKEIYNNYKGKKSTETKEFYAVTTQDYNSPMLVPKSGTPMGSATLTKDLTKFGFVASNFKVSKTDTTDTEITITGTYTLKIPSYEDQKEGTYDVFASSIYDLWIWTNMEVASTYSKNYKDLKSNVTLIFDRETKQIKSADIKCIMPKGGYKIYTYAGKSRVTNKSYYTTYTFTHKQ